MFQRASDNENYYKLVNGVPSIIFDHDSFIAQCVNDDVHDQTRFVACWYAEHINPSNSPGQYRVHDCAYCPLLPDPDTLHDTNVTRGAVLCPVHKDRLKDLSDDERRSFAANLKLKLGVRTSVLLDFDATDAYKMLELACYKWGMHLDNLRSCIESDYYTYVYDVLMRMHSDLAAMVHVDLNVSTKNPVLTMEYVRRGYADRIIQKLILKYDLVKDESCKLDECEVTSQARIPNSIDICKYTDYSACTHILKPENKDMYDFFYSVSDAITHEHNTWINSVFKNYNHQ